MNFRYAIITVKHSIIPAQQFVFTGSREYGDSRLLNAILSEVDPGTEYSVAFTNIKPRITKNRSYYFGDSDAAKPYFRGSDF